MLNVFRILGRDLKRILKAPAVWSVLLFLMVLPSLYTWLNVKGFWDPYANASNLRVCVVNLDEGYADDLLGTIDVGAQIVEQLANDDQLGWCITDREDAIAQVNSGEAYAAFEIPPGFSANMASVLTPDFTQPQLEYYVNEKLSPIAPKFTDVGSTRLDATINDAFVSQASAAMATAIDEGLADTQHSLDDAGGGARARVDEARGDVAAARDALATLQGSSAEASAKAQAAREAIAPARTASSGLASQLDDISRLSGQASASLLSTTTSMATALDKAVPLVTQASSDTSGALAGVASDVTAAKGDVDAAVLLGGAAVSQGRDVAGALQALADDLPDGAAKEGLEQQVAVLSARNDSAQATLDALSLLSGDLVSTSSSVTSAASATSASVQDATAAALGYRTTLSDETVPALGDGLTRISQTATALAGSASGLAPLLDQTDALLGQLAGALDVSGEALFQTDDVLSAMDGDLATVATDIAALQGGTQLSDLVGGGISVERVASFMKSPTVVETEELYHLNSYGSALAPLFINLTLWIGAFMLMVIMRVEVDGEGAAGSTGTQRYIARWLLFAMLASAQAVVCVTGCLAMGVQTVSPTAFYLAAIVASITYMSIQYTLSATMQHVGKGLCVVLIFVQIPGATGLYPIEMMPGFFRAAYPIFPFTYGINAMREAIAGFYDGTLGACLAHLLVYLVVFMVLGLFLKPRMGNLNRMFARQLEQSDIMNVEQVDVPPRHFRRSQVVGVLSNREEYRRLMVERLTSFEGLYPRLRAWSIAIGIAVPVVTTALFAALDGSKTVLLTLWLTWILVVMVFLIAVEYVKDNISRQLSLGLMSDEQVRGLYARNRKGRVSAPVQSAPTDLGDRGDAMPAEEGDAGGAGADASAFERHARRWHERRAARAAKRKGGR